MLCRGIQQLRTWPWLVAQQQLCALKPTLLPALLRRCQHYQHCHHTPRPRLLAPSWPCVVMLHVQLPPPGQGREPRVRTCQAGSTALGEMAQTRNDSIVTAPLLASLLNDATAAAAPTLGSIAATSAATRSFSAAAASCQGRWPSGPSDFHISPSVRLRAANVSSG